MQPETRKETNVGYELTILLASTFRLILDKLHSHLAEVGHSEVRPAHGFAFQLLSFGPVSVNRLAEHLNVTKQAASQLVEYLEATGYVTKELASDKRGRLISLTEKGWDCIHQTEQIFSELEQQMLDLVGAERLNQMRADLRQIGLHFNGGNYPGLLRPSW